MWHAVVGTTKTEQSNGFVTVTDKLREVLLDLWKEQASPAEGYILAGESGKPINLDNLSKRNIRPLLKKAKLTWHGWYSLRRFAGTEVAVHADSETAAKALRNTKAVAERHYIKPETVLPDVREAVNSAMDGLVN